MQSRIYVDGRITAPEEATLSVLDRGVLYGDSVYEVLWWHRGAPVQLEAHLARLERSAAKLYLKLQGSRQDFIDAMLATVAAAEVTEHEEAYVRLVVTRGAGPLGLGFEPDAEVRQTLIVIVAPARRPDAAAFERGLHVAIVARRRTAKEALDPAAKTGNYMNNALALHEARLQGADDALLLNAAGGVTEASTANVYVVRGGALATPPVGAGLLAGTTRARLLALCREADIPAEEASLRPEDVRTADEVFVSSSVRGVVPVVRVDEATVGAGVPGPVTRALHAAFEIAADEDARAWHDARKHIAR